jgi:ADP-heptose:LPS heptosyltransferase
LHPLIERALDADPSVAGPATATLFRDVVEPLSDSFDPAQVEAYVNLFAPALGEGLAERYRRIRAPQRFSGADPAQVVVLSRVTLGADAAITSVMLDAIKKRFRRAVILLAGARKAWELFEADPRIGHLDVPYPRAGTLRDRLAAVEPLRTAVSSSEAIVVDPDSRLTQLGLLPVCDEDRYYFFESRAYGADGEDSLVALARRWAAGTFEVEAYPYISPAPCADAPEVTISLGVGENPRKRIADPFESSLVRALSDRDVLIDQGAGGEEAERVARAIAGCPRARTWDGSFAGFAARIARSRLYIGYDSAGQHAAAALGVPLATIFAGFPSERMLHRWRPSGKGPIEVVRLDDPSPADALERTLAAIRRLAPFPAPSSR